MEEEPKPQKRDILLIIIKLAYISLIFLGAGIYSTYIIYYLIITNFYFRLPILDIPLLIGAILIFIISGIFAYSTIKYDKSNQPASIKTLTKICKIIIYSAIVIGIILLIFNLIPLLLHGPG